MSQELSSATQATFEETPYNDATWEVVGEVPDATEFAPMELSQIRTIQTPKDPMFADYGGVTPEGTTSRWHLPEHLAFEAPRADEPALQGPPKIELTEEELAHIRAEAESAGRLAALEESATANQQRLEEMRSRIEGILSDVAVQSREASSELERRSIELALAIAQKVIGTTVEVCPEYIIPIVQSALGLAGSAVVRRVRVSPQDYEFIQIVGVGKDLAAQDQGWEFVSDDTVRSGCIVETSAGDVDFELDRAWERIKEQVVRVVR